MKKRTNIFIISLFIFFFNLVVSENEIQVVYGEDSPAAEDSSSLAQTQSEERKELPPPKHYQVKKTASEVRIDGVLDEDAWKDAPILRDFYEWLPGDNIPPPVETECLVTFDANRLYIAFRCFDPEPRKIRAHLMDRDAMDTFIQDDHISIIIDPFNDERRGFQFRINPLGVQEMQISASWKVMRIFPGMPSGSQQGRSRILAM